MIVKNLSKSFNSNKILDNISFVLEDNDKVCLIGNNGTGKSTLLAAIMGHPKYNVTSGSITLDGKDVFSMSVDERSRAGLFLAMQYPQEIPGVTNSDFLRAAMNARSEKPVSLFKFIKEMDTNIRLLKMKD